MQDKNNWTRIGAIMARDVGDRITLYETPPGFSSAQTGDYTIQQLAGQFQPGPYASATIKFLLWPASTVSFWTAGDAEQSLAGITTRPGY
jgi:hypothetical protein